MFLQVKLSGSLLACTYLASYQGHVGGLTVGMRLPTDHVQHLLLNKPHLCGNLLVMSVCGTRGNTYYQVICFGASDLSHVDA